MIAPAPRRPAEAKVPWARRIADVPKALHRGPRGLADLLRAVVELARANRLVASETAALPLLEPEVDGATNVAPTLHARERAIVDRVAYAVPVMALRVPWRADCLVQALAAKRWLAGEGIASQIALGTALDDDGGFLAHAWLRVGNRIVTGGDVTRYHAFENRRAAP